jgi:hypothetical protein
VNKQHRQAYLAIKEVSQDQHGWQKILLEYVGVSRQSYNKFFNHSSTQWEINNNLLTKQVSRIYELHNRSIGAGKILLDLKVCKDITFKVTLKQVKRVMRDLMITCIARKAKKSQKDNEEEYIKDNILNQNFKVSQPHQVWLADSTQLEYGIKHKHKVQLSGVLDLYGRRMISYHISPSEDTDSEISTFKKLLNLWVTSIRWSIRTEDQHSRQKGLIYFLYNMNQFIVCPGQERLTTILQ